MLMSPLFWMEGVGTAKIGFEVAWIYPRLLVGNVQRSLPSMSITHTYYDCTQADRERDYWFASDPDWHDASLMVPVNISDGRFTRVYFYPIYSPSEVDIGLEIYNSGGCLLGRCEQVIQLKSPGPSFSSIDMGAVCERLGINSAQAATARVLAHRAPQSEFPSRIKLGLDIGHLNGAFPCNICTNLHPFNPALETKPHCFRWSPLFAQGTVWLINSSPARKYTREAVVKLTFFRVQDTQKLDYTLTLSPHGSFVIDPSKDRQLRAFLGDSIGWCTATSAIPIYRPIILPKILLGLWAEITDFRGSYIGAIQPQIHIHP